MSKNIKILLICSIMVHCAHNLLAPIYAIFIKKIGGTLFDAGLAIGIYAIIKGFLYFATGKWLQYYSKKKMIFLGYTIFFISYILYLFANHAYHVFAIQCLLAIGETIMNPSWSAIIALSLEEGKEVHIYSHFYGYRSICEGIAAILGGLFAMKLGFTLVFIAMAVLAFFSAVCTLFLTEECSQGGALG